jgi:hypothetical protein
MLLKLLGLNKKADKGLYELIKMMCGLKGNISVIFVFMPGVARPSFQSAGSYPAQTIMNAFL